jgi:hypothetical protein
MKLENDEILSGLRSRGITPLNFVIDEKQESATVSGLHAHVWNYRIWKMMSKTIPPIIPPRMMRFINTNSLETDFLIPARWSSMRLDLDSENRGSEDGFGFAANCNTAGGTFECFFLTRGEALSMMLDLEGENWDADGLGLATAELVEEREGSLWAAIASREALSPVRDDISLEGTACTSSWEGGGTVSFSSVWCDGLSGLPVLRR